MDVYEEWDVRYKLTLSAEEMRALKVLAHSGYTNLLDNNVAIATTRSVAMKIEGVEVRAIPVTPTREV